VDTVPDSDERFRLLANSVPVLIWMSGTDPRRTWFNEPWLTFVGRNMEQELGDGWLENVHPDDVDQSLKTYRDAFNARLSVSIQYRLKRSDGTYRWMRDDGAPVHDAGGELTGYVGSSTDISDQKHLEEAALSLSFANEIIASSDDAILSKTLDGVITSWNVAAERMFGYTAKEACGKRIDIIIPYDRIQEERMILERLRRGERIDHYETVRRSKDGRSFDISLTISPVRDESGKIIGASKIARDITDRKRAEFEHKESERRKDEFLAILAHELRNPLAPVRNAVHYLKLKGPEDTDLRRPIEMIDRQVAQMARLIDDLLDVSRISRGVLELRRERFALAEVVGAAVDGCHDQIQAQGQTLRVSLPKEPVELEADRERLIQVLYNLIANASKYTPTSGRIELTAAARNRILDVSVKDNGIGIPPGKLTEIFELFSRVDSSLERQGGLGIGLTLARQLTELHGGTIEARSDGIGRGSEFVLKLPIVAAKASAAAVQSPEPGPACTPLRILVADDSYDAVESLALLLQMAGHDVHKAFDGEAAITSAEKFKPDVALLDIGMPKANGYEVARSIREHPWGKRIYLVALTGWGQEADKLRAQDVGFDAHLVKPVAPEALNRLLATVCVPS
jgi:two-component system, chemotaxis family, CheB/CheR fusion protein